MNARYPPNPTALHGWQRFVGTAMRAFHVYASWLVGVSWKRFALLSRGLSGG